MKRVRLRARQWREARGLTQEQLAEKADVGYKYYQAFEAGRRKNLTMLTLERIARTLGIDAGLLMSPTEEPAIGEAPQAKYRSKAKRRRKK